jgi:glyoxylase-like metal-dependent hydrolase (beta-lactamase superfamily II)
VQPSGAHVHAAATSSAAAGGNEVSRIDAELSVQKIAPDAFVVTHEPFYASNVLVVRMADGTIVLCSSPYETQAARALVRWVHETFHPPRVVAINTHFHFDGTGGNEAYRDLGVTTFASEHTQQLLKQDGKRLQAEWARGFDDQDTRRRVETMKIVEAEKTFPEQEGLVLRFGGEEARVVYPGAGHSLDNVVVFFPSKGILFGGCMIKSATTIGYIGHADLDRWESSVEVARGLGARVVVPGHGKVSGPDLFDLTIALVRDARGSNKK